LTGYAVQYNKAIVGRNAFAHGTALAASAVRRSPGTYEIMDPTAIGLYDRGPVLDRESSREALRAALETLGVAVGESDLDNAFARFQQVAAQKRHVTALDLELLVIPPLRG
jgi:2-isopropylmalate synthase